MELVGRGIENRSCMDHMPLNNFIWTIMFQCTGYLAQEVYSLDFISATADSIGKNMQEGRSANDFQQRFLLDSSTLICPGVYVAYNDKERKPQRQFMPL